MIYVWMGYGSGRLICYIDLYLFQHPKQWKLLDSVQKQISKIVNISNGLILLVNEDAKDVPNELVSLHRDTELKFKLIKKSSSSKKKT
jgi:hypothetical protein